MTALTATEGDLIGAKRNISLLQDQSVIAMRHTLPRKTAAYCPKASIRPRELGEPNPVTRSNPGTAL
jgi:hypothetical protein